MIIIKIYRKIKKKSNSKVKKPKIVIQRIVRKFNKKKKLV